VRQRRHRDPKRSASVLSVRWPIADCDDLALGADASSLLTVCDQPTISAQVAGRGEGVRVGRGGLSASSRGRGVIWLPTTLPQTFRSGASSAAPGSSRALSRGAELCERLGEISGECSAFPPDQASSGTSTGPEDLASVVLAGAGRGGVGSCRRAVGRLRGFETVDEGVSLCAGFLDVGYPLPSTSGRSVAVCRPMRRRLESTTRAASTS
jgi:hypothetical protein